MCSRPILIAILLLGGLTGSFFAGRSFPRVPKVAVDPKQEVPANRGLDANLYIQTAAEYRACCFQAYNLASFRLKERLAIESVKKKDPKFAVIMDLDETVFDNGAHQATMLRGNLAYDQAKWDSYEEFDGDEVTLIPGAKEFILEADKLGVSVVYISNRNERFREQTTAVLKRLELPLPSKDFLKLSTTTSNKTTRREEVDSKFFVLLLIGDNLRDFDDEFRARELKDKTPEELTAAIQERKATVDKERAKFGDRWIILPNPAYGEWQKPLGQGNQVFDRLVPSIRTK